MLHMESSRCLQLPLKLRFLPPGAHVLPWVKVTLRERGGRRREIMWRRILG